MKHSVTLILWILFVSCHFQCQNQNTPDFSANNVSHKDVDAETGWLRMHLRNPNKWGYITKDSIVVIPFEYDFLNPFENGLAYAENNQKKFFITKDNLKLEGDYDEVRVFSEGLAAVRKNKKWGFIDNKGNLMIPIQYDTADYFRGSGLCEVTKNGKSGFINKQGEEVIPIVYEDGKQEMKDQNVIVKKNGKWAVFDNAGKQLSEFKYDELKTAYISDFSKNIFDRDASTFFENGAALGIVNGKYEFINLKAEAAFPDNKFDSASVFDTFKNAMVKRNGKYGIIKTDGTFKVPLIYDLIEYFDTNHSSSEYYNAKKGNIYSIFNSDLKKIGESHAGVYNDFSNETPTLIFKDLKEKAGMVDREGNVLIPFEYDNLRKIENTLLLSARNGGLSGVISNTGKVKIPVAYKMLYPVYDKFDDEGQRKKNLFIADGTLIDINNKVILNGYDSIMPVYYDHNKLIVSRNKKFGIINVDKKIFLPVEYDEISNWVEYGPEKRHFIRKKGKYGLIEYETFKTVIPPVYDRMEQRGDIIFVTKGGKAGILDIDNKELCHFIFDEIKPHRSFSYRIGKDIGIYSRKGGRFFRINLQGEIQKEITEKEYKENTTY
ncbi:WG repeat-containing protein [uncultured Chryseobacterium sp.]|uniref:WG repeat-containing protein n=1 Tax=uncultured Chryseobacterium sp. TaxID=259322 RepID=UPI0025F8639A|nr:WG repeat-containing protein [uncultured Chryseobacterium sp.]